MFELDINKIKEQSMQFVDTAYKAAMDIADKGDRKSTRLNSSHTDSSRMPSSA